MIPKIIHFIWLTPPDGKEFNIHHAASVKSAKFYNPDFKIKFHCDKEPASEYFQDIKDLIEINFVVRPDEVFGIPIKYMVMKGDVLRLRILIEQGGVYQDLDIITMRSYENFLKHGVVLGTELSPKLGLRQIIYFLRIFNFDVLKYKFRVPAGLCAGFIMCQPQNQFMMDWLEAYKNFNNDDWAYLPVKKPYLMVKTGKYNDVHVIGPYQTHFPSCAVEDLKLIFEKNLVIKDKLFLHVWETRSYEKYLKPLSKQTIKSTDSTYCNAIKEFI